MATRTEQNHYACPECGGSLTKDTGETFCNSCGLVVENGMLDRQLEPYFKGADNHRLGRGETTNAMHDKSLGSIVSYKNVDANGDAISDRLQNQTNRIREEQRVRQFDSKAKWKRKGLTELLRIVSAMELPDTFVESAAQLFNQAHDADLAIGRSVASLADACAFITSRIHGYIREKDEWVAKSIVNETTFNNMVRLVQKELDVGYLPPTPSDHTNRVLDNFDLSQTTRKQVIELVNEAEGNNVHIGSKPEGIVGAAIYLSAKHLTQERVGDVIGMAPKTIRKNAKAIEQ